MTRMAQPMTPPPPAPAKRGPMFWVAIGCLVLVLLGALGAAAMCAMGGMWIKRQAERFEENPAIAAAELAVRANPDFEVVESDPERGTITVRNKKTGEVVTWDAAKIESGEWTVETEEGTTTMGGAGAPKDLPSWLPVYPGGAVQGAFDSTAANGERSAAFNVTTPDPVAQVLDFYATRLEASGLAVQRNTFEGGGQTGGTVTGTSEDQKRAASVMVSAEGGQTTAVVTFTEKP